MALEPASRSSADVTTAEDDADTAVTSLTGRQQFWRDHLRRCDTDRIPTKTYAEPHGFSLKAMYSARKDLVARGVLGPGGRGVCNLVDFRTGRNGNAALVEASIGHRPFSERLFVFCNRRRDRVKPLYWGLNSFCLWQKRLEEDRFHWPRKWPDEVITLSVQQLNWLLDGYDISQLKPLRRRKGGRRPLPEALPRVEVVHELQGRTGLPP